MGWGGGFLPIMHIPRPHSRPSNQNHRECDLEICIFSKQAILRFLKVYESLTKAKSLRGKISPRSTALEEGESVWASRGEELGFHPEAWSGKSEDAASA